MTVAREGRTLPTNSGASSGPNGEVVAADLLIGPQPRARRDIAADALAIA